jgi:NAD(P)-dependent dehydrogenase (short-subunit alcohol dehydrogenase family)
MVAYAQSKTADVLLAAGISRRWAGDGITANSCEPGWIYTNLQRHLDAATMQAFGAMDDEGNLLTPDYYETPRSGGVHQRPARRLPAAGRCHRPAFRGQP